MDERRTLELIDYHVTEAKELLEKLDVPEGWKEYHSGQLFQPKIHFDTALGFLLVRVRGKLNV